MPDPRTDRIMVLADHSLDANPNRGELQHHVRLLVSSLEASGDRKCCHLLIASLVPNIE